MTDPRPTSPIRAVFMGTPDFAVPSLEALANADGVELVGVIAQPNRPAGRGKQLRPQPVAAAAAALGVEVFQPESMRAPDAISHLSGWRPDLIVVAAYGQILRAHVLDLPRYGCINVHASLLPRWRGAAPIHRAIEAGDAVTGVSIMAMDVGLDTGAVYAMEPVMVGDTETAGELHDRLATLGASLLVRTLPAIIDPSVTPTPQPGSRTSYARMLGRKDRLVDFGAAAQCVVDRINGMSPWPGARMRCGDETLLLLRAQRSALSVPEGTAAGAVLLASPDEGLHVATGDGAVELLEVQRPGKKAMPARQCLLGVDLPIGTIVEAVER